MKVADVKLSWSPSVSAGIIRQVAKVAIDGAEPTALEVGPEVESVVIEVKASSSVVFWVETTDDENFTVISEQYTFQVKDLDSPLPATNLFHEIIAVRDLVDPVVVPVAV